MNAETTRSSDAGDGVSRRWVLAAAGTAAAVLGSGCAGARFGGGSDTIRVRLSVANYRTEPNVLQVLIVAESEPEPIFWKAYDFGPYDTSAPTSSWGVVVEDLQPLPRAETTIYAKTEAAPDVASLSLAEIDGDCIRVSVKTPRPEEPTAEAFIEVGTQCPDGFGESDT